MALQQIVLPNVRGFDFGIGVDRLSGMAMNQVVEPRPSESAAPGAIQSFEVSRIHSTHDLQQHLGIDVEASYGCAAFGAGVSARFNYLKKSEIHSSLLFMTVTATIRNADLSIDTVELTTHANEVVDRPDVFATRFGDVFCRSVGRGGLFVGVMRVETYSETDANQIEAQLRGSYGFFSADVANKFSKVTSDHNASVYCKVYAEGGPALTMNDPTDPKELLRNANLWMQAMHDDPEHNSVAYEWTMAPITIAAGPLPPNAVDLQHAQDVLGFCARARTALLDQLNLFMWIHDHPERYDFSPPSVSKEEVAAAARSAQSDLDTVASCASNAITNPSEASFPADFASARGHVYPALVVPAPLPKAIPPPPGPSTLVVPDLIGKIWTDFQNDPFYAPYREEFNFQSLWEDLTADPPFWKIISMSPPAGSQHLPVGSTINCGLTVPHGSGTGSATA
jgi:hypothetical protein